MSKTEEKLEGEKAVQEPVEVGQENSERHGSSWLGRAVKAAGWLGAAVSLLMIFLAPFIVIRYRGVVQDAAGDAGRLLLVSGNGLRQTGDAVGGLADVLETVVGTLDNTAKSLEEVEDLSITVYDLLNGQIPTTLEETSVALQGVEAASGEIDSVMRALAAISFLTGVDYNPTKPLDEAVAGVAESLDPISDSMKDISESLMETTDELSESAESLDLLASQLTPYSEQLDSVSVELENLALEMEKTGERLNQFAAGASVVQWAGLAVLELFLVWSLLGQIAVYTVGDRVMKDRL